MTRKPIFLNYKKRPKLRDPIMLAAWPGMGSVAIRAAEFLWDHLKPKEFAEFSPEGFFFPQEAFIMNGQIEVPRLSTGKFYYWQHPKARHDLVLFICEAQPAPEKGYLYAQLVLDVAQVLKIRQVFTFASMPMPIDHLQDVNVWATVTDKRLLKDLLRQQVKHLRSGQISGLNGLLLSVAKERDIAGICLLAEIPLYAIQIENPKASKAVLKVFSRVLGFEFDFTSLDERARIVDEEIDKLIEYFKSGATPGPISEEELESFKNSLAAATKLPDSARSRIEELFRAAQNDLTKAGDLKKELDRWHIYKEYEDRFLDLFRHSRGDSQ